MATGKKQRSRPDQVQVGLVTFPSYHVYDAIVFAWATWQTRGLRWPVAILNVAMVLSTLI
jgi:hypothetical protein